MLKFVVYVISFSKWLAWWNLYKPRPSPYISFWKSVQELACGIGIEIDGWTGTGWMLLWRGSRVRTCLLYFAASEHVPVVLSCPTRTTIVDVESSVPRADFNSFFFFFLCEMISAKKIGSLKCVFILFKYVESWSSVKYFNKQDA